MVEIRVSCILSLRLLTENCVASDVVASALARQIMVDGDNYSLIPIVSSVILRLGNSPSLRCADMDEGSHIARDGSKHYSDLELRITRLPD